MKHIISCGNGDAWRRYALNMAHYGAALRRLGLPAEHEERRRAREGFRRGVVKAREEQRHVSAAGRLLRAQGTKKPLSLSQAWRHRDGDGSEKGHYGRRYCTTAAGIVKTAGEKYESRSFGSLR